MHTFTFSRNVDVIAEFFALIGDNQTSIKLSSDGRQTQAGFTDEFFADLFALHLEHHGVPYIREVTAT